MLLSYIAPYFVGNEELIVYTHNMLLDIAVEYGIIGVALLFFWGGGGSCVWQKHSKRDGRILFRFCCVFIHFLPPFWLRLKAR
nr:hypothetical protein [Vibrio vulnificus]